MKKNYKSILGSIKPTLKLKSIFLFGTAMLVIANAAHSDSDFLLKNACHAIIGVGDLCITPQPFQPSTKDMAFSSQIYKKNQNEEKNKNNDAFILVQGVPFARYWQLKDSNQYVFHPAVYGRYIFDNLQYIDVQKMTELVGIDLPNKGLTFFYPNIYPLSRMNGQNVTYSTISQGDILSGYMKYDKEIASQNSHQLLERVKKAFFLPYERGGIDLSIAQLEIPLFHSNPEIILNGWLHALLRLNDYALTYGNEDVANYIHRNLEFFEENNTVWYDKERNISRYSDTSPQSATILSDNIKADFVVIYESKIKKMKHYLIPLKDDPKKQISSYENKISSRNIKTNEINMILSCSGFFNTVLVSDSPFKMKIRSGGYTPNSSSPTNDGDWYFLKSQPILKQNLHKIVLPMDKLICGYPTNFSKKNNKNFYHMQHIIALLYLANYPSFTDVNLTNRLKQIAKEWYENTKNFKYRNLDNFENAQKVLSEINRSKSIVQINDVNLLFDKSDVPVWD